MNVGRAHMGKMAHAEVVATFSRVIELKPDWRQACGHRGWLYSELHQYDKAIADCSKAIELDPKFASAWSYRGASCCVLGALGLDKKAAGEVLTAKQASHRPGTAP